MKKIEEASLRQVGFVSRPHGFFGEVVFAVENGNVEQLTEAKYFFLQLEGRPVPFLAEKITVTGQGILIVKLEDVNSETEAKKLTGKKIYSDAEDTFSTEQVDWNSVIGYQLIDTNHGKLGILEGIEEYPQQLIGRFTRNGKEILFPINEEIVTEIDDGLKELHLLLPEGLLDIYLDD